MTVKNAFVSFSRGTYATAPDKLYNMLNGGIYGIVVLFLCSIHNVRGLGSCANTQ